MNGRDLRNFTKYKKLLEVYAKALQIKVEYKSTEDEAYYSPSRRTIRIDPGLDESYFIAVFLHELGHVLDDAYKGRTPSIERAYGRLDKWKRLSDKQNHIVVSTELRAWTYGESIASVINIPVGKWFTKAKRSCMRWYHTQGWAA